MQENMDVFQPGCGFERAFQRNREKQEENHPRKDKTEFGSCCLLAPLCQGLSQTQYTWAYFVY